MQSAASTVAHFCVAAKLMVSRRFAGFFHDCFNFLGIDMFRRVFTSWVLVGLIVGGFPAAAQSPASLGPAAEALPASSPDSAGAVRVLGPGDTVVVTVFGQPDLSARVTVTADGTITLPLLGEASVAGYSPARLGRLVAEALRQKGYLNEPQVAVEVVQVRSQVVSLLGEVQRPGRYVLAGELTLLQLLAQAGGLQDDAGDVAVVMRANPAGGPAYRFEVPLSPRQEPWQQLYDMPLAAGDVVQIAQQAQFFVYGEVNNAGAYFMQPGVTVMRALALAGGLTPRASERRVEIRRTDPVTGRVESLRASLDTEVLPGDVVYVNERFF